MKEPWKGYVKPFRIWGNLYFVGTEPASTHIVDTGDGLILFDSGYQQSLYLVIHNMHLLGLNPLHLKYIVHTHGHIDHMGATRALIELTKARTFLGEADKDYVNGVRDLSYAKELGMDFTEFFDADVLLNDGDKIRLGNTEITAVAIPGHTEGAMSYFFDVYDGERVFRAGLHGGMGINTLTDEFLSVHHLPFSLREDFINSMNRLKKEKVDIFLGNHMQHNDTLGKYQKIVNGDLDAFVNPREWADFCELAIQNLDALCKYESNLLNIGYFSHREI